MVEWRRTGLVERSALEPSLQAWRKMVSPSPLERTFVVLSSRRAARLPPNAIAHVACSSLDGRLPAVRCRKARTFSCRRARPGRVAMFPEPQRKRDEQNAEDDRIAGDRPNQAERAGAGGEQHDQAEQDGQEAA
jgi:hypothetical protein